LEDWKTAPTLLFFVSVDSKGVRFGVSRLFVTLAGRIISVAAKGVMGTDCWQESNGLGWEGFEGVGRTTWRAPIGGKARKNRADYTI